MKPKLVSIAALVVLVLLAAAMACSNDSDDNLETPATGLKESTPQAKESKAPTGDQASSTVFPRHDAPLGTDRGGNTLLDGFVINKGCLRAEAPLTMPPTPDHPGCSSGPAHSRSSRIWVSADNRWAWRDRCARRRPCSTQPGRRDPSAGHGPGLVEGLSEDCTEPYLLVGDEVTVFDPKNEATELRLSDPDVLFLRGRIVMGFPSLMAAEGIGELLLDGQCLRLGDSSTTIIWPAGFTPHSNRGVVHVRNGAGRVIATVGDEIAAGGGYRSLDRGACPGEVFSPTKSKSCRMSRCTSPSKMGP